MADEPDVPADTPVSSRPDLEIRGGARLFAALAKAQSGYGELKKTKTVKVTTKTGGSYSFDYAPLEEVLAACLPALHENDLVFTQHIGLGIEGEPLLHTVVGHESGEFIRSTAALPKSSDVKETGSAVTYMRRYAAQSILGVAAEDDDDAGAATGDETVPVKKRSSAAPTKPSPSASARPSTPAKKPDANAGIPNPKQAALEKIEAAGAKPGDPATCSECGATTTLLQVHKARADPAVGKAACAKCEAEARKEASS